MNNLPSPFKSSNGEAEYMAAYDLSLKDVKKQPHCLLI